MNILPDEDLPFDASMLDRLAMIAIRVGLNLQPGQDLIITGPVEALPLIRRISAEAYKNEAGVVSTILSDDELQLTRYEHATDESLDRAPDWMFKAMGEAYMTTLQGWLYQPLTLYFWLSKTLLESLGRESRCRWPLNQRWSRLLIS